MCVNGSLDKGIYRDMFRRCSCFVKSLVQVRSDLVVALVHRRDLTFQRTIESQLVLKLNLPNAILCGVTTNMKS